MPSSEPQRGRTTVGTGSRRPLRRSAALLFALGIAASACGSGDSTADAAPADDSPSATAGTDDNTGAAGNEPADTSTTADPPPPSADEDDQPAADPGATLANYPQVDVVDLGSGGTVNFAEQVAGGSLPTLIWFWAPH